MDPVMWMIGWLGCVNNAVFPALVVSFDGVWMLSALVAVIEVWVEADSGWVISSVSFSKWLLFVTKYIY